MLGGEVIERQQFPLILEHTLYGCRVFVVVGFNEQIERFFCIFRRFSHPDFVQGGFDFRLRPRSLPAQPISWNQ